MKFPPIIQKFVSRTPTSSSALRVQPEYVLWGAAVVLIAAGVWVLQGVIRTGYRVQFADPGAKQLQSTRLNFDGYNKAAQRIQAGAVYEPGQAPIKNPFKTVPKETPTNP
jgi:hypothetical protein